MYILGLRIGKKVYLIRQLLQELSNQGILYLQRTTQDVTRAERVKVSNTVKMSDFFYVTIGFKQGESLSPLLFILFINDIKTTQCVTRAE